MSQLCICQSGKSFDECCERFINGQQHAKTPVQLMRSRFSAYALGGHGEYLFSTWASSKRAGLNPAELSVRSIDWTNLEVIEKSQSGNNAVVEFKAYYSKPNNDNGIHHEVSTFERIDGHWFYVDGEVK